MPLANNLLSKLAQPFCYLNTKKSPLLLSLQCSIKPATILGSLVGFAVLIPTIANAAVSNIDQVTIYQGMASVTRSLPVNITNASANGEQVLVFSCLSSRINDKSVSIQADDGINIGEISIEKLSGEQANLCKYQSDAEVRTYQDKLDNINAELEATKLAKDYLHNLTEVSQISIDGSVGSNASDLQTKATSINKRLLELQKQQAQAQEALNQLMAGSSGTVNDSVTQVSVRTASRRNGTVKLHYQVQGAGWQPTYQARLNTESEQLNITASAIIAQQTGENWINVPLTLSTVNPNKKTGSYLPHVSRLDLYDKEDRQRNLGAPAPVMMAKSVEYAADAAGAGYESTMDPLPSFNVSSNQKNGITEYHLPQRVSIPADGRRIQTVIDEQSGTSKVWLRSTPQQEAAAYWYASAPFITPAWVDGSLQLYRDGNYIGQTRYEYQTLKEQGIGFGVDPNLIVKQLADEANQGDSGVISRSKQQYRNERYQLTNMHNRSVSLEVLSSEPVSQNNGIKLTVTHTPPVSEQDWNHNQGIVAWTFDLAPKQSQVVQSTVEISYPASKELIEH